jgi:heme A synthase
MQIKNSSDTFFSRLALTTSLLTFGLIIFGAVVRVTDSGLGCGNEWPLCDGRVVPPLDNVTAWIEWSHRLFAVLIGLFGLGMLYVAVRAYRNRNRLVLTATGIGAGLFLVQSGLGAFVVVMDLPPTMVTLHLGTAMLLLGALLLAAIAAWHKPPENPHPRDMITMLAYMTAALSLIIILTGALVRGSGATLACTEWPLCGGNAPLLGQTELQTVHMMHRVAVGALGLALVMLVWYIFQARRSRLMRWLAVGAFVVYLVQALVGGMFVLTSAAPVWGATHVGMAALTWALLVGLSAVDTLNSRSIEQQLSTERQDTNVWNPQSEKVTN